MLRSIVTIALMKIQRKFSISTLMAAAFVTTMVILPKTGWACYGISCIGSDPAAEGCAGDAVLLDKAYMTTDDNGDPDNPPVLIGWVELYYSPICHAKWATSSAGAGGTSGLNGHVIGLSDGNGFKRVFTRGFMISTMTDGSHTVSAYSSYSHVDRLQSISGYGSTGTY